MSQIEAALEWPVLLVMLRTILVLAGIFLILLFVTVLVRFGHYAFEVVFFWRELPAVTIGGKLFGQEFALKAQAEAAREAQLDSLEQRISNVERASESQAEMIERIVHDLLERDKDEW